VDDRLLPGLLERCREIAGAAAEAIRDIAADIGRIEIKEDRSPLTRADLASHRLISSALEQLRPAFPVISEEGDLPRAGEARHVTYWLVDPLDGTKEFVKGLPEYTVNIALVEGGRPVLGVIHVPAAGELYSAAAGLGSHKQAPGEPPRRLVASTRRRPRTAVVSRSHLSEATRQFLDRLNVAEVTQRGSSLKICAVAEGAADVYPRFGPTWYWDTAAGTAIAREAGCRVVDLGGQDLGYDLADGLKHNGFIVSPAGMDLAGGAPAG
jgi:3'(2'), 5'-bisphosphate nucleotidase